MSPSLPVKNSAIVTTTNLTEGLSNWQTGHGKQTFEQPGLPHTPVKHWGMMIENLSLGSNR